MPTRELGGCALFDREGNGPAFVVTPQDVAKHGIMVAVPGGYIADVEGWHRALVELEVHRPELRIPHRPRPKDVKDDAKTCTCEGREGDGAPHARGCPAEVSP